MYRFLFSQFINYFLGELQDSKSQSHVWCNLAYAYSQIENYNDAKTSFKNAIECCKDCKDTLGQCLATEGLAAIYFREQDYQNSVNSYKEALALISKTGEQHSTHGDRIVNKLAETVEYQLKLNKSIADGKGGADGQRSPSRRGGKGQRLGRRRVTPSYNKYNSLVAKGLEQENEDEAELGSSSFYETESESSADESGISSEGSKIIEENTTDNQAYGADQNERRPVENRRSPHLQRINGTVTHLELEEKEEDTAQAEQKHNNADIKSSRTCVIQ